MADKKFSPYSHRLNCNHLNGNRSIFFMLMQPRLTLKSKLKKKGFVRIIPMFPEKPSLPASTVFDFCFWL